MAQVDTGPADDGSTADKPTENVDQTSVEPKVEDAPLFEKPAIIHTQDSFFKRAWTAYLSRKKLTIPLTIVVLLAVICGIPQSRYAVLGLAVKKPYSVQVVDAATAKPVTSAVVELGGKKVLTDNAGNVSIRANVGKKTLSVSKKYFKTSESSVLVPLKQKSTNVIKLAATGRQVVVTVTNKISGTPVVDAVVTAAGTEGKTDKTGKVTMVLPADKTSVEASVTAKGFNTASATIKVTGQSQPGNGVALSPSGRVYFLSKLSGKIDVVRTNLDGSDRHTVLAGTGKEDQTDTILLASRDWKYLVLKSKRDGGEYAKLFVIDTATDKAVAFDEGDAYFELVGWSNHHFAYVVTRQNTNYWDSKVQAIKTYNAETAKLATIDQTDAEGGQYDYVYNRFSSVYIINNELVYNKNWSAYYYAGYKLQDKAVSLYSAKVDGSNRRTVKEFPIGGSYSYYSVSLSLYGPAELYIRIPTPDNPTYYEFEDGKVVAAEEIGAEKFNQPYPTYLSSPSGKQTLWYEERDGKNAILLGNEAGDNEKTIANLGEYIPYGWYSDDYILLSKKSSELYILPASGKGEPIKITDYHKPSYNFRGYGGGYGGL